MKDEQASQNDVGLKRRGLLRLGALITALTGASSMAVISANSAHAASGDKASSSTYVPISEKGAPSGVATLDAASKIVPGQLPDLSATYGLRPDNGKRSIGKDEIVVNVKDYGALGNGMANDSAAFAAALAAGHEILVPTGTYLIDATVIVPAGKHLYGAWSSIYTGNPTTGARLIVTNAAKTTPVIKMGINAKLSSLSIAGVGKATARHEGILLGGRNVLRDVTVSNCFDGINAAYTGVNRIDNCQVHDNGGSGVKNPVDSFITHCYFNVNGAHGIKLEAGANDNVISHTKFEWNTANGIIMTGSKNNVLIANNIDRNGLAGLRMFSNTKCVIASNVLRRNGKFAQGNANEDTHIYQQDNTSTVFQGNVTVVGTDDNGANYTSPLVSLRTQGGTDVTFTANDFAGCSTPTAPISTITSGTRVSYFLNTGLPGVQTVASSRVNVGSTASQTLASTGGTGVATFSTTAVATFTNGLAYRLRLVGRDPNSATRYVGEMTVLVTRNSGDATVSIGGLVNAIGAEFGIGSGNLSVAATTSVDGSSLTITVTNNAASEHRLSMVLE